MVERAFINVTVTDLETSQKFYEALGFTVRFSSSWFVQLGVPDRPGLELGLLHRDAEIVPPSVREVPAGVMFTLVVPDVDAVHEHLREVRASILEEPRNLFYGQRRMLVRAPEGTVVDISSECPPDPEWMKRVHQADDGSYRETS